MSPRRHYPRAVTIETSATMPGPPEVVWSLITDWEHQDDWMLEASDFVVVSEARAGVGVEAEATVRIAGIATRDRVRIVAWEEPHRLAMEHLGWVGGTGELFLTPADEGATHVFWREELHPPRGLGVAGWVGLLALRPVMRKVFGRDLRVLQGLVRARASR